jgi:hypothetical protein
MSYIIRFKLMEDKHNSSQKLCSPTQTLPSEGVLWTGGEAFKKSAKLKSPQPGDYFCFSLAFMRAVPFRGGLIIRVNHITLIPEKSIR